jgi:hypothetical protein
LSKHRRTCAFGLSCAACVHWECRFGVLGLLTGGYDSGKKQNISKLARARFPKPIQSVMGLGEDVID